MIRDFGITWAHHDQIVSGLANTAWLSLSSAALAFAALSVSYVEFFPPIKRRGRSDRERRVRPSVLFAAAVERAHRRQIIHDCAQLGVGFRLQAAMPGHGNKVIHLVVANGAQSPHEGFRLV